MPPLRIDTMQISTFYDKIEMENLAEIHTHCISFDNVCCDINHCLDDTHLFC